MRIDHPSREDTPALRQLWKLAFGDSDEFLDIFFTTAFSPSRCRCLRLEWEIAAVLYWFDCSCGDQKIAYLYAVATHPDHRGKGLCRELMENTQRHLKETGCHGVILVPQDEGLFRMYGKMGYRVCSCIREFSCTPGNPIALQAVPTEEYAAARRDFLPTGGVIQEGENLTFLAAQANFYRGHDVLLASRWENGKLFVLELLGNSQAASGILGALGGKEGTFRTPGEDNPFAMFLPLQPDAAVPSYFGFAFD